MDFSFSFGNDSNYLKDASCYANQIWKSSRGEDGMVLPKLVWKNTHSKIYYDPTFASIIIDQIDDTYGSTLSHWDPIHIHYIGLLFQLGH